MIIKENINEIDFGKIREASSWNTPKKEELKMHKIHVYPAKFPSFLITKSLEYTKRKKKKVNVIGDIFCGCGTTALEAKRRNINFWGCDINPVATLIARVKSEQYDPHTLKTYHEKLSLKFPSTKVLVPNRFSRSERINYWFDKEHIIELYKLLYLIKKEIPRGKYQRFFLVAFSNILKGSSRWLTTSIKPTIDKKKKPKPVLWLYSKQFKMMLEAAKEASKKFKSASKNNIANKNFLKIRNPKPFVDLMVTSPPYVTSYEYADIHQLSSLWLGYTNDYRDLRDGSIGSIYHKSIRQRQINELNTVGRNIYDDLFKVKKARAKSVVKYFLDMKNATTKAYSIINPGGYAVFVIGNTSYKGIQIDNAKYLSLCMQQAGFKKMDVYKRKISSKILTPYRDKNGKFSGNKRHKKIYSYEFILIGRRKKK